MAVWSLWSGDRRRRTGRGLRAAVASLLVPGLGQWLVGRRVKAAWFLGVAVALGAGAAWLGTRDTVTLAGWALTPEVLLGVIAVNLSVLVFRLYATFDAYADGVRPPSVPALPRSGWASFGVSGALLMVAVVAVLPHVLIGYYTMSAHDMLSAVFAADSSREVSEGGSDVEVRPADVGQRSEPRTDAMPQDPPTHANPWQEAGRITIALLGSDAGPGRDADRIDALLVVTVDTRTGDAAVFSVDRYLADFPLPARIAGLYAEHCPSGEGWRYINALYRCADERVPEDFAAAYPNAEDPAAAAVADVLSELLGIGVPHYVLVDMAGFVAVVDALGGVELDLAEPLRVRLSPPSGNQWNTVDLAAGPQVVDGEQALAFVRVRERDGGDADRMRRQRCLASSVVRGADVGSILRGFPALTEAIEQHAVTSIPIGMLPDLIEVLPSVDPDRVVAVGFGPPEYRGWDHRPDVGRIQQRVRQVLQDPDAALRAGATTEIGDAICR